MISLQLLERLLLATWLRLRLNWTGFDLRHKDAIQRSRLRCGLAAPHGGFYAGTQEETPNRQRKTNGLRFAPRFQHTVYVIHSRAIRLG